MPVTLSSATVACRAADADGDNAIQAVIELVNDTKTDFHEVDLRVAVRDGDGGAICELHAVGGPLIPLGTLVMEATGYVPLAERVVGRARGTVRLYHREELTFELVDLQPVEGCEVVVEPVDLNNITMVNGRVEHDSRSVYDHALVSVVIQDDAGELHYAVQEQRVEPVSEVGHHLIEVKGSIELRGAHAVKAECYVQLVPVVLLACEPSIHGPADPPAPLPPSWRPEAEADRLATPEDRKVPGRTEEEEAALRAPRVTGYDVLEAIRDGAGEVPQDPELRGKLVAVLRSKIIADDVEERLEAVKIAGMVGGRDGLAVVDSYLADREHQVRLAALDAAVAARHDGLPVVRAAMSSSDPAISARALHLLAVAGDEQSVSRARSLLGGRHATVRAAAARLLGCVGASSARYDLTRLLRDEYEPVRLAAKEALEILSGERDQPAPRDWWEPHHALPEAPPAEPDVGERVPVRPPAEPEVGDLPLDPAGLLVRLGEAGESEREAVVALLRDQDTYAVQAQIRDVSTRSTQAFARGAALATAALELSSQLSRVSGLLKHSSPLVRVAALECLGDSAGSGYLTTISPLLTDEEVPVRVAAALALARVAARSGRESMARGWLEQLDTKDEDQKAAKDQALALMEAE